MSTDAELSKPELFVGIDQSYSGFGLVVLNEFREVVRKELLKFPPMTSDGERLWHIYSKLNLLFEDILPWSMSVDDLHFVMEGYAFGKSFNREKLGELGGVVKMSIFNLYDKTPTIISPRGLKKFMTGKGNASKEDMVNAVQTLEPSITNHNLADAYGLAYMLYSQK